MIIYKDVGFIHIPRTGGTSVRKALFEQPQKTFYLTPVSKIFEDIKSPVNAYNPHTPLSKFADYSFLNHVTLFTVIRNPWDRYVSWYKYNKLVLRSPRSFDSFMEVTLGDEKSKRDPSLEPNPVTQSEYLKEAPLNFKTLRFESLDKEWKALCHLKGLDPDTLRVFNSTPADDYREYYESASEDWISKVREVEGFLVNLLGYRYDK